MLIHNFYNSLFLLFHKLKSFDCYTTTTANNNNNFAVVSGWKFRIRVCAGVQKRNKNNQRTFFSWTSKKSFSTIRSLSYITISPSKCRLKLWNEWCFQPIIYSLSLHRKRPLLLHLFAFSFVLDKINRIFAF